MSSAFPFSMSLIKATRMNFELDDHIKLFFVLRGSLQIETAEKRILLTEDDILVLNPFQQYQLTTNARNLFLYLNFSREDVSRYFNKEEIPYFACSTIDQADDSASFQALRSILTHLMSIWFREDEDKAAELYQYFFTLLAKLIKDFRQEAIPSPLMEDEIKDQRMVRLLEEIHSRYADNLTLEKLAKEAGISYYHLSRLFKEHMGITFTGYLNQVRMHHALEELLLTDHSILKVAMNNGFATAKTFHQGFRKRYNTTPMRYRQAHSLKYKQHGDIVVKEQDQFQEVPAKDALQELARYMVEKDIETETAIIEENVELYAEKPTTKPYANIKKIIKLGSADDGLSQTIQQELTALQAELDFDLIQFEGFCHEINFEYDVSLVSEYILNNQWFDFLQSIALNPMIILKVPASLNTLAAAKHWCETQLEILHHFLNRYGPQRMGQWYLQILPESCWNKLSKWAYTYFYRELRQLIPECKIGILAISSLKEEEALAYKYFLLEQKEEACLPDFINFHADPYLTDAIREKYAFKFKYYQKELLNRVKEGISSAADSGGYHPEVFLSDWNTLVGEGNALAGTFFRSALILESIIELSEEVSGLGFWLNIKLKERLTHKREDSSLSVFLYAMLKRPLFFSLRFLKLLEGDIVKQGAGFLLTKKHQSYQLLLYNSSYIDPSYSVDSYQVQYLTKHYIVKINHLPAEKYQIRHYTLDKDNGGIYNDWMRVSGSTENDQELLEYLTQKILPRFELTSMNTDNKAFTLDANLSLNACQLFILQPIY